MRLTFRLKTILGVGLIQGLLLTMLFVLVFPFVIESAEEEIERLTSVGGHTFAALVTEPLLSSDLASLTAAAESLSQDAGVVFARVLGADGMEVAAAGNLAEARKPLPASTRLSDAMDGIYRFVQTVQIAGTDFGRIEIGYEVARLTRNLARARERSLLIVGTEIFLVALFSLGLGTYLTRQLRALGEGTERIAAGELGYKMALRGNDELSDVARRFNQMSEALKTERQVREKAFATIREQRDSLSTLNEALNDEKRRAVELYEKTPAMLHSINPQMEMVAVSDHWLEVMGYTREEIIGAHPRLFLSEQSLVDAEKNAWPQFFKHGVARDIESQYVRKDGHVLDVLTSSILERDSHGDPIRSLTSVVDITQRKAAERALAANRDRLQNILTGTNAGTWEWNVQTGETRFNERWAEMIGYTLEELEPVSIETWGKYAQPDDLAASGVVLQRHFDGETPYYEFESRMLHRDGHWIWVRDHGRIFERAENGEPLWMMGTHIDISHLKQVEADLEQALEAVSQISALKDAFMKTVSHELRTPLNGIIGMANLLEREDLSDQQKEYMRLLSNSAERLQSLVNSTLELTRLLAGEVPVEQALFNPGELVERVGANARKRFAHTGIELTTEVTAPPKPILGDSSRLTRCLETFINNAFKYTKAGHVSLRCRVETSVDESVSLRFEVEDSGCGIAAERLPYLFQVFEKGEGDPLRQQQGAGLSLAIAGLLVQQMGGKCGAQSTLGEGSCFWIVLPLTASAPELAEI